MIMIKKIILPIITLLLFSFVSASCSDVNLDITGVNMKYNFMKGVINSGETQIKEIKVYLDGELKMTDTSEIFKKNILFPSFNELLSIGQEIKIDIVLKDGTICKDKEVLIISEDKIMVSTLECNVNQKKEDWCVKDLVMGTHCENGIWIEFIDVDCNYWNGTCKNGKCVEVGNESNVLLLTELDKSPKQIEELNDGLREESITFKNEEGTTEIMYAQPEKNSSPENRSSNPIATILNWITNLFK